MNIKIQKALELLKEAKEGKGAFDTDQLKHAGNTIEDMKTLIGEAIDELEKEYDEAERTESELEDLKGRLYPK